MEKKIKIKSTSLTPLNETLQKLKLNDTIKDFTPVIVEADGKFTSIMNTKEEFNPNDLGSAFETEETENEENKETKEQLLNKAKDALKQTLSNSNELNSILQKMQDLSKEDGYNTWEVNKEKNTATLKSKNASIFKQNNNICLSHNGKIELFNSVEELRNWLKENGYPLPGNDIVIHESVEIKEGRNWVDLLNDHNSKKKVDFDNASRNYLDQDTIDSYTKEINDYDADLQNLYKQQNSSNRIKGLENYSATLKTRSDKLANELALLFDDPNNKTKTLRSELDNITDERNSIEDELNAYLKQNTAYLDTVNDFNKKWSKEKQDEIFDKRKALQTNASHMNRINNPISKEDQALNKPIPKEILQAANRAKPAKQLHMDYLEDDEVEECCTGTAALGPAVAYVASPKKTEETELKEDFESLIPGDTKRYAGKRPLVNKFLTWYKRNKSAIEDGSIKLPDDFKKTFSTIIEPTFLNNASDSVSKIWSSIIKNRLLPLASKLATAKKIPEKEAALSLINNPSQKICDLLSSELNNYIPNTEEYMYGKIQLQPGVSLLEINKNNPNYQQRMNWQKAYYQSKNSGESESSEVMINTFNALKDYLNKQEHPYTDEELELAKKYNIQLESVIFESAKNYPWLNKILNTRLVEDDSPADFAQGSPLTTDTTATDTADIATDTTTDTSDVNVDTSDILGDIGGTASDTGDFGDINISNNYSPDEGTEEEIPAINLPEYKIIDVLMNDDTDEIKVKVQNTDTKETEIKDLEDIDV